MKKRWQIRACVADTTPTEDLGIVDSCWTRQGAIHVLERELRALEMYFNLDEWTYEYYLHDTRKEATT